MQLQSVVFSFAFRSHQVLCKEILCYVAHRCNVSVDRPLWYSAIWIVIPTSAIVNEHPHCVVVVSTPDGVSVIHCCGVSAPPLFPLSVSAPAPEGSLNWPRQRCCARCPARASMFTAIDRRKLSTSPSVLIASHSAGRLRSRSAVFLGSEESFSFFPSFFYIFDRIKKFFPRLVR